MVESTLNRLHRFKRIMWLVTPVLLMAAVIAGVLTLSGVSAAPTNSPLNGHYYFHGVTTTGQKKGFSLTGKMSLLTVQEGVTSRIGNICDLNVAFKQCTLLVGTTPDNVSITFTMHSVGQFPALNASGMFDPQTGFKGTFSFGTGANVSSGKWSAYAINHPSVSGTYSFTGKVLSGTQPGQKLFQGILSLVQLPNNAVTGEYCINKGTKCMPVSGASYSGYMFLNFGKPALFIIRGSSIVNGYANGQLTVFNSDNRGIWHIYPGH